jgi:hypothetical protein
LFTILQQPDGSFAGHLADVTRFASMAGTRHRIPPDQAFIDIIPSSDDQQVFRANVIVHVAQILSEEIQGFAKHRRHLPKIIDPSALEPTRTEEYFLPTYDQEQSSTQGNMLVLRHYFQEILSIPTHQFEKEMFFVLGDRLTTARDRAAQDQRAVDRSENRADHLSSHAMLSGMMHVCMNMVSNMGKNFWGGPDKDTVSLATLLAILPNRGDINLRKVDFYAWLRFLDVVLRALVIKAVISQFGFLSSSQLAQKSEMTTDTFMDVCAQVVDVFILSPMDRLEADGIKKLHGNTTSGHAVLMMHDLMTMREMRHAVRHGHPERMQRMIKYWAPMFYAGGGYNYANECMELLHNLIHDWPKDTATILRNGMLVNTTGDPRKFKETDIRVEQFNKTIKSHTSGANARPGVLEKITPALGHVQGLTEQLFLDLGLEADDQHHAEVKQHKDVQLLVDHLCDSKTFDFSVDKLSEHPVIDLYRMGLQRLAGQDGGHAKHLSHHVLRFQTCHDNQPLHPLAQFGIGGPGESGERDRKLAEAQDAGELDHSIEEPDEELHEMIRSIGNNEY